MARTTEIVLNFSTASDGTKVLSPSGRVDGSNSAELHEAVTSAIGDDDRSVVMDMSSVSYISSAGMRVLLIVAQNLTRRDTQFAVAGLVPSVAEVFKISGFDQIISVRDTV